MTMIVMRLKNLALFCGLFLVGAGVKPGVDARAVNISNTWTLPEDGFPVFYRYFRDKISWFEADAVCQFHHANLVTVDNGVQFDAARAFLKELDVTNPVWIGLMRPENSARFTWTNAKTLDQASGYWAEALPVMETPLCAVVDPVRDFRWHALRCGGPETAAFLCELPVPSWALDCTVTSMPSLTVQYMSDSGAVQLARDCGEQGTRHMSCQGKLDRDTILQQLQCSDHEVDPAQVATENNQLPVEIAPGSVEIMQQQQLSVATRRTMQPQILEHDILTVVSNNDEDNNIDVNPNQIEDTVKNVINKFNLADLMQNDQSLHSDEMDGHYDEQEKEAKKLGGKKYSALFEKKGKFDKKGEKKVNEEEDMMMGDQPDETETQPIDIVQQAVKPTEGDSDESSTSAVVDGSTEGAAVSVRANVEEATTVDSRLRRATDVATTETTEVPTTIETQSTTTTRTTTMEPTTTSTASHILPTTPKKEISALGDHFIPPMLLVKARFTSTKGHVDTITSTTEVLTETTEPSPSSSASPISSTEELTTAILNEETYLVSDNGNDVQVLELNDKTSSPEISTTTEFDLTTGHQIVEITFEDKELSSKIGTLSITTRPFKAGELHASSTVQNATVLPEATSTTVALPTSTTTTTTTTTTTVPTTTTESVPSTTTTASTTQTIAENELHPDHDDTEHEDADDHHDSNEEEDNETDHHHPELHNSFSNIENFQPYKPNRHRSLTKPEVHNNHGSYIKKILG